MVIGEALALATAHRFHRALHIADLASVVAEIELGKITVQVLLPAVLINAAHAAFEDREKAFNRIGMNIAAHILNVRMHRGFVRRKFLAHANIVMAFVCHKP